MLTLFVAGRQLLSCGFLLGMTEKEATGEELNSSVSLFGEKDFAQMEGTVKLRKEYQDLFGKLGDPNRKPGTGKKKLLK